MRRRTIAALGFFLVLGGLLLAGRPFEGSAARERKGRLSKVDRAIRSRALATIEDGRNISRFDTFGDEASGAIR